MYDNITFLISYQHATCGHFIQLLLLQLLNNDPNEILEFPSDGTASKVKGFTFYSHFRHDMKPGYNLLDKNIHDYIIPLNSDQFSWAEHPAPNWESLFSTYTNAKNIIIKVSDDMILRSVANSHYKLLFTEDYRQKLLLAGIDCNAIDHEQYVKLLHKELTTVDSIIEKRFNYPYRSHHVIPEQYKDKVYELELYDIIHDKEKTLGVLETITGNKALPNVHLSYDTYLENQRKLIPWLDDKRTHDKS